MKRLRNSKLCKWVLFTFVLFMITMFANAKNAQAT